jgi:hypothetical protein
VDLKVNFQLIAAPQDPDVGTSIIATNKTGFAYRKETTVVPTTKIDQTVLDDAEQWTKLDFF